MEPKSVQNIHVLSVRMRKYPYSYCAAPFLRGSGKAAFACAQCTFSPQMRLWCARAALSSHSHRFCGKPSCSHNASGLRVLLEPRESFSIRPTTSRMPLMRIGQHSPALSKSRSHCGFKLSIGQTQVLPKSSSGFPSRNHTAQHYRCHVLTLALSSALAKPKHYRSLLLDVSLGNIASQMSMIRIGYRTQALTKFFCIFL